MKDLLITALIVFAAFIGFTKCTSNNDEKQPQNVETVKEHITDINDCQPRNCSDYVKARYLGSSKSLNGKTYVVTVYAREIGENDFSEREKNEYRNSLSTACDYLKRQASRYGKTADFYCAEAFGGNTVFVKTLDKGSDGISSIYEQIFNGNYYASFNKWMKDAECDNYMILIYTNRYGSCNNAESAYIASNFYCEGCMINKQTHNNFTSTLAHEMLHNFGAIDLYNLDFSVLGNSQSEFDNSIMVRSDLDNSHLYIDEITAYLVGLTNEEKGWYNKILSQY